MACRWPRLLGGENGLPADGVLVKLCVEGDFMRLFVEGDFAKAGIIEVVFKFLTLWERAIEDFVGVMSLAARRGSAV